MALPAPTPTCLREYSGVILSMLHERKPKTVEGLTKEMHELPPFIPKVYWAALGDLLKKAERPSEGVIPGEKWISLRLDGTGFSKYIKMLRRTNILQKGYSGEFANIMQECLQDLMEFSHAWVGYSQSDEMSLLIPPARVIRGAQSCHMRNGRVQKLASLNAARVTAVFNHEVMKLCASKGLPPPDRSHLATFDCRVGSYDTEREALSLLLWRSYDSGINGVTDACFHHKGVLPGAKEAVAAGNDQKLAFLMKHDLLPLHPHQAYGSFCIRKRAPHIGYNPVTKEEIHTTRSKLFMKNQCFLTMFKDGGVEYVDERLEEEKEKEVEKETHSDDE